MTSHVPRSKSKNPYLLANYLTAKYDDNASKSYAISYWIAHNIKYDYKGFKNNRTQSYSMEKALKKRKALCEEYSDLYREMCEFIGIQAFTVGGYTKDFDFLENDTVYNSNHAWNITLINDNWQLSDHTFAAGKLALRRQPLKHFRYRLFGIYYKPKFYFKQEYDPNWIDVNPSCMIQSHFPELQMFQLLQNPVSVYEFSQEETTERLLFIEENHLINNYIDMPFRIKRVSTIHNVKEVNPFNNKAAGYQHYMLIDDLHKIHYNLETKTLDLPLNELLYLKTHVFLSDSLLKEAQKDNEVNYQQKKLLNQQMRKDLKVNNKELIYELQQGIKQNKENIKTSIRLQKNSKNIVKYCKQQNKKFKSTKPLETVKRSTSSKESETDKIEKLLSQLDSIQNNVIPTKLSQIDSLNVFYTHDYITQIALVNQALTKEYPALLTDLKKMEKQFAFGIPFRIHKHSYYLEKNDITSEVCFFNILKKQYIDTMMNQLRENQDVFLKQTKQYTQSTRASLNLLKSIKKTSTEQQNEDIFHAKIIIEYLDNLSKFKEYSSVYKTSQKELVRNMKVQNRKMTRIISRLKKESKTENFRHYLYNDHLKSRHLKDNIRIKTIQTQLKKYQTEIEKGLF